MGRVSPLGVPSSDEAALEAEMISRVRSALRDVRSPVERLRLVRLLREMELVRRRRIEVPGRRQPSSGW